MSRHGSSGPARWSAGVVKLIAVPALLACASASAAQDQVMGLLTLPELFGTAPCEDFAPADIALYATPDESEEVGYARVVQHWTFHEVGGCEGLVVRVHIAATGSTEELPVREHAYEAPAAVVLDRRGRWFRIRLESGTAWLRSSDRSEFHPLEALLADNLTYVARPDGIGLAPSPGDVERALDRSYVTADRPVRVLEARRLAGRLWLRVELLSHSVCGSVDDPWVVAEGWLPAHTSAGEPTIWFYSRGC